MIDHHEWMREMDRYEEHWLARVALVGGLLLLALACVLL